MRKRIAFYKYVHEKGQHTMWLDKIQFSWCARDGMKQVLRGRWNTDVSRSSIPTHQALKPIMKKQTSLLSALSLEVKFKSHEMKANTCENNMHDTKILKINDANVTKKGTHCDWVTFRPCHVHKTT
ncbi:hypothetical protein BaRGS_00020154 [Batillaria attramentaria]|uniref:Uncharacterized protein n=1 Tax=Batillaria attramentaria TaxID=370345 RepID=A0ABD0KMY7_9CAEN